MDFEELMSDPDWREYKRLYEQIELWRERAFDESLSAEERAHAESRYVEVAHKASSAMRRLNKRHEEMHGPLPKYLGEEVYQEVRNRFANEQGIELTLEEVKELIHGDDDDDPEHSPG
jgi:hypothetical protein